jgi:hypothetical protein
MAELPERHGLQIARLANTAPGFTMKTIRDPSAKIPSS